MTRLALAAAVLALPIVLAACGFLPVSSPVEVPLGSGAVGGTTWTAVAYDSREDGVCVEVRFAGDSRQTMCRGLGGPLGANVLTPDRGGGSVVIVEIIDRSMVEGSITFDLRPGIPVAVVDAGALGRYAVASSAGPDRPLQLRLRDSTGRIQEAHDLP